MTVDQALQLVASLIAACLKALQAGKAVIDLAAELQAADDAARADLAAAIQCAERRLAEREPASGLPGAMSFQIDD